MLTSLVINSNCGGQTISQTWLATDCCTNSAQCGRLVNIVAGLGNNLVVPNTNANVEGNFGNEYPFDIGAEGRLNQRYQQVYASSQFGAVPPGGAFITAICLPRGCGLWRLYGDAAQRPDQPLHYPQGARRLGHNVREQRRVG